MNYKRILREDLPEDRAFEQCSEFHCQNCIMNGTETERHFISYTWDKENGQVWHYTFPCKHYAQEWIIDFCKLGAIIVNNKEVV